MIVTAGPLLWPLVGADCGDAPGVDSVLWGQVQAQAVEWLWAASGRRLGTRVMVVRPGNASSCGVAVAPSRVRLPGPVQSVTAVQAFGGTVDPASYRYDGGWLTLVDGTAWPMQDWAAAEGDPGYWAVTYLRGAAVPVGGQVAAGELACELLLARTSPDTCRLPSNAIQVARAGVTISLADLQPGSTGLASVDQWIATVNPDKRTRRPRVWSPDLAAASAARTPAVSAASSDTLIIDVDGGFLG